MSLLAACMVSFAQPRESASIYNYIDRADDIAVRDDYLYAISRTTGFFIFDISTPDDPTLIARYPWGGYTDLHMCGDDRLTMTGEHSDLFNGATFGGWLVDVSDPEQAILLDNFNVAGDRGFIEINFAVSQSSIVMGFTALYGNSPGSGSVIWEIQDRNLVEHRLRPMFGPMVITNDRLYDTGNNVRIFDISDPEDPGIIFSLAWDFWGSPVYNWEQNLLAIGKNEQPGLFLIEIVGDSLFLRDSVVATYWPKDYQITNEHLYWTTHDTLWYSDISDPANPSEPVFGVLPPHLARCLIQDSNLYALDSSGSVSVISLEEPRTPEPIADVGTHGYVTQTAIVGERLFVAAGVEGLRSVDITQPENPRETGHWEFDSTVTGVTAEGNLVAVRWGNSTLAVTEVGEDGQLTLHSTLNFGAGNSPEYIELSNSHLFCIWTYREILIHDLSDPTNPREVSRIPMRRGSMHSRPYCISGEYLFMPTNRNFYQYSITDPNQAPVLLDSINFVPTVDYLFDGNFLHTLHHEPAEMGWNYFYECYDVTNTQAPRQLSRIRVGWVLEGDCKFLYSNGPRALVYNKYENNITIVNGNIDGEAGVLTSFHLNNPVIDAVFDNGNGYFAQWSSVGIYDFGEYLSVESEASFDPSVFELSNAYPNPFNNSIQIDYSLPTSSQTSISIYNQLGKQVAVLYEGRAQQAGPYAVTWDASGQAAGVYFVKMDTGQFSATRKVVLVK